MTKVANIIEDGRYGGPQARITAVSKSIKQKGFETTVILPNNNSDVFLEKLKYAEVPYQIIKLHHLTKSLPHLLRYIIFFVPEIIFISKIIKKERYAIVHCNGCWQFKGVIASKLANSMVVWHLNDLQMPRIVQIVFSMLASHWADGFIFASEKVKKYYSNKYLTQEIINKKPHLIVQAPVDTKKFDPEKVKPDINMAQMTGLNISTIANINYIKGLDVFIKMCKLLRNELSETKLDFLIIGNTYKTQKKYANFLKKMKEDFNLDNLHFWGAADNINEILKATDIYVCSSLSEASPTAVWEAMSMSKAIVSTDVGDVGRIFGENNCGLIVPPNNPNALAKQVSLLVQDQQLRNELASRTRTVAIENLDLEVCKQQHISLYRSVLKNDIKYY